MHINVAQIIKGPVGSSRSYRINESVGEEGIDHIKGNITLTRTSRSILAKGAMIANVTGICSRCLSPVASTVSFNLEDEFFSRADMSSGSVLPAEFDNSTTIDDENMLDLSEVMRQYTILAMPTKLLCHPDCVGLCPSCGHDLNQSPCQCPPQINTECRSELVHLGKESKI